MLALYWLLALFFARYWQRQNKTCISYLLHGKFIGLLMPKQRELFKSIEIVAWIWSTLFHRQSSDEIHFNWIYLCIAIESWFCIEKPMHVTKQWNWHQNTTGFSEVALLLCCLFCSLLPLILHTKPVLSTLSHHFFFHSLPMKLWRFLFYFSLSRKKFGFEFDCHL